MSVMFRDPKDGALARRRDLLGRRRDELVTMPHAVRRVVVARWARIAGCVAAWLGAEAMVLATVSPTIAGYVAKVLPGHEPAPLSTLLVAAWVLGLVGYFIARSAAEHRFAVAMSRTVMPGEDLYHDLDRLDQVHPDDVARTMAHGLEVLSAALPVAAAATIIPATVGYIAMGVAAHGWPSDTFFELWLVAHAKGIAVSAILGLFATILMTKQWARRPAIVPAATGAAAILGGFAFAWGWLVGPAAIAATFALVGRRLRIERARIQAEDPAAGSEVFTLRGMIAEIRASLYTVRAFVRWHRRGFAMAAVALPILLIGWRALHRSSPAPVPVKADTIALPDVPSFDKPIHPTYEITRGVCRPGNWGGGCSSLQLHFTSHDPIDIPSLFPGMPAIPQGWHAELGIHMLEAGGHGVTVVAFPTSSSEFDQNPQWLDSYRSDAIVQTNACTHTSPATIRVTPDQRGPAEQYFTLIVEPRLELASVCP
jgi:hypothetical protein